MNNVTYISVPFSEKDHAKSLGAKWDPKEKSWYIPQGVSKQKFARWMLSESLETDESFQKLYPPVYIVESKSSCWKCSQSSRVVCIASKGFRDDEMNLSDFVTFSNVSYISQELLTFVEESCSLYKPSYSKTAGGVYYMSHCEHCGAKLGDFFMHSEPGGAFHPVNKSDCKSINLVELPESEISYQLSGNEGLSYPCYISQYASRKHYNKAFKRDSKRSGLFIQKLASVFKSK